MNLSSENAAEIEAAREKMARTTEAVEAKLPEKATVQIKELDTPNIQEDALKLQRMMADARKRLNSQVDIIKVTPEILRTVRATIAPSRRKQATRFEISRGYVERALRGQNIVTSNEQPQSVDEWTELNALAEQMAQSLDRIHVTAQEVIGDLRAARQDLAKETTTREHAQP